MLCMTNYTNHPRTHTLKQNSLAKDFFLKTTESIHIMVAKSTNQGTSFLKTAFTEVSFILSLRTSFFSQSFLLMGERSGVARAGTQSLVGPQAGGGPLREGRRQTFPPRRRGSHPLRVRQVTARKCVGSFKSRPLEKKNDNPGAGSKYLPTTRRPRTTLGDEQLLTYPRALWAPSVRFPQHGFHF